MLKANESNDCQSHFLLADITIRVLIIMNSASDKLLYLRGRPQSLTELELSI